MSLVADTYTDPEWDEKPIPPANIARGVLRSSPLSSLMFWRMEDSVKSPAHPIVDVSQTETRLKPAARIPVLLFVTFSAFLPACVF